MLENNKYYQYVTLNFIFPWLFSTTWIKLPYSVKFPDFSLTISWPVAAKLVVLHVACKTINSQYVQSCWKTKDLTERSTQQN